MGKNFAELREQRLQAFFDDCQQQVLSQIIGPFGLSSAMFKDRNGGNVTTLHNFGREDSDYIATETDKVLHAHSRKKYDAKVRDEYEVKTKVKASNAGGITWEQKRDSKIARGVDEYTGNKISSDGTIKLNDGHTVRAELDHVVSVKDNHQSPKIHLALGKTIKDPVTGKIKVDVADIRQVINSDENLAITNQPLNGSKSDEDLKDWSLKKREDGKTNVEKFDINEDLANKKYERAKVHIKRSTDNALLKKQSIELLHTGSKQALAMGMRQSMGLLLTELVNALFDEFKILIKQGVRSGVGLFEEIRERIAKVISSVAKKIPDAVSAMFQGGVSGFMSNLITFIINNFVSTAKRFVTVIREGLLGLFRAFKIIFFPPKNMTKSEALKAGLKILTTVVVSSIGLLLSESVGTFMATVPFLKPFADLVTPVLIGIMTGLLSAFLAYQIDCLFDRYSLSEKFMDELQVDSKRRNKFADELLILTTSGLSNIENYSKSISLYQNIGSHLASASRVSSSTINSLNKTILDTQMQVSKSLSMIDFINESQIEIDDFLKNL